MKSFDERAEQGAERPGRRGEGEPTPPELRAVRKALASRRRPIQGHLETIDTMLRIGGRGNPDEGPSAPGTRGFGIVVERMKKVAEELRLTVRAVDAVDFDAGDKQKMKSALIAAAKSWEARAKMANSMDPVFVQAALRRAEERDAEAARLGRGVMKYFGEVEA